ncbi:MAG TPA: PglZ domain-containing protein, partial [Planctomycetota bacterium]|nr:PglZ domain-containing protein [Planctomycetota bacterium]
KLNHGEPKPRAELRAARAPLPSITALGMAFALAEDPKELKVELEKEEKWRVTEASGEYDLSIASERREWLRKRFKSKSNAITTVKTVLDDAPPTPKESGRLVFVFGDELDAQGHEGELEFTGADEHVERYVRAVRRLRDAGYSTVAIVTDHGFIHWDPEEDEVETPPKGEVLWRSRRAVVGRDLEHPRTLATRVTGSDLECHIPPSVNAFRTYGRLGFFHGGATLQELITPFVIAHWPKKAEKVAAVLVPITEITSLKPRVEVRPGVAKTRFVADELVMSRQFIVKVVDPRSGRRLFGSDRYEIQTGNDAVTVPLEREPEETCARGTRLQVEVRDAENDELLDRCVAELKIDIEEWD